MTYIKDFSQVGRGDLDEAGGKGANLGELARAGFPVPPGFVLTTAAYQDFANANGIAGRILELGALPAGASNDDYDAAARQVRSLFPESIMPEEIDGELRAASDSLSARLHPRRPRNGRGHPAGGQRTARKGRRRRRNRHARRLALSTL
jgi:pyruvate,water dikinase